MILLYYIWAFHNDHILPSGLIPAFSVSLIRHSWAVNYLVTIFSTAVPTLPSTQGGRRGPLWVTFISSSNGIIDSLPHMYYLPNRKSKVRKNLIYETWKQNTQGSCNKKINLGVGFRVDDYYIWLSSKKQTSFVIWPLDRVRCWARTRWGKRFKMGPKLKINFQIKPLNTDINCTE